MAPSGMIRWCKWGQKEESNLTFAVDEVVKKLERGKNWIQKEINAMLHILIR